MSAEVVDTGAVRPAEIALVAAVSGTGVIGRDGGMPWRLPTDLARFKTITLGTPVVMGRKTWDSLGRPLPGRTNIVVTRSTAALVGAQTVGSLAEAIAVGRNAAARDGVSRISIIGGGEIYAQAIGLADELRITRVLAEIEGDTRFPTIDLRHWRLVSLASVPAGLRDSHAMEFADYRRIG